MPLFTTFITRDLTLASPFYQRLSAEGWQVSGMSLLEFSSISFDELPAVDWIFFYSKNGIKYFFEQAQPNAEMRYATIGRQSADFLFAQFGIQADFVGTGEPTTTASAFIHKSKGARVLFPCAKNSRHSIQQLLDNQIETINLIVYNNRKKTNFSQRDERVLVFTSPLNAVAYFEKYTLQNHQKLVAIGHTTARQLEALGYAQFSIADAPSEEALAVTVIQTANK